MERIGVVGLSWRDHDSQHLARFTLPAEGLEDAVATLAHTIGVSELVYVATCNRVEVAFVAEPGVPVADYRPRIHEALGGPSEHGETQRTFRAWGGEGAAEHLFLVTAGLDSARLGETEITGQVRRAFDLSKKLDLAGPRLGLIFEEALKIAAKVQKKTALGNGSTSLAEIALGEIRRRVSRTGGQVALVGVSPMTERCAKSLAEEGIPFVVVNRTESRARELAQALSQEFASLQAFRENPPAFEAMVSATGASATIFDRADLERMRARTPSGEPLLAIDMSIPADVDPDEAVQCDVERIGMDDIIAKAQKNRSEREFEAADARTLLDNALDGLRRRLADRMLSPVLGTIQRRYRRTAKEGLEKLLRKDLITLQDGQRQALERWAETLAARFAHIPSLGLKGLAYHGQPGALEAFLSQLDDELAVELREAVEASRHQARIQSEEPPT